MAVARHLQAWAGRGEGGREGGGNQVRGVFGRILVAGGTENKRGSWTQAL